MQIIYLVRHGETLANLSRQWQGEQEPLSERGHEQARQVAERLRTLPFEQVFCSTLLRARDTAETIMRHHTVPVTYTAALAERRVPSSTIGATRASEPDNPVGKFLTAWEAAGNDPDFRYEDEETVRELVERAGTALEQLGDCDAEQILAVTHGTFLRIIINTVLQGGDASDPYTIFSAGRYLQTTNTGLSVLVREDKTTPWQLLTYNDHAHFADN